MMKKRAYNYWTKEEIKYLRNSYKNIDSDLLKLNLNNHSWNAIKRKASFLGIRREIGLSVDEDFFKTWVPEMAYIFGFWIADGNMGRNNNKISFSSSDYDLIKMIKFTLNSGHKIGNWNNNFQLTIYNRTMHNDLLKLGGTPAKSLTIQFPEVPVKYLSHFIRGYLDGDGSFFVKKINKRKDKYLASNFVGNIDFLTVLKDRIKENANIDLTSFCIPNKNCNQRIYSLQYFGKKAIALGDYIYQDSENLRLERKYKIYNKMKREYLEKLKKKNKKKGDQNV